MKITIFFLISVFTLSKIYISYYRKNQFLVLINYNQQINEVQMLHKMLHQISAVFIIVVMAAFSNVIAQDKISNYDLNSLVHKHVPMVDHSQFDVLKKDFKTPQEVTETCLSCHNKAHEGLMKTSHWLWTETNTQSKRGEHKYGKYNSVNNFCISIQGNWARCTSCHAGYGYENNEFDFTNKSNIDCLVCHDQSGTYKKFPTKAGYPVTEETVFPENNVKFLPPDYNKIAQSVGIPKRQNCGVCHYSGGGGNNVKHGDLEKALNKTTKKVDVHMGIDGANMRCAECHTTENHNITGQLYIVATDNEDRVSCTDCHEPNIHNNPILNRHTETIACQTCHIPEYAKVNPTKMSWDWSKAGENRKPSEIEKFHGKEPTYNKKKGEFTFGLNVKPDYVFFNGTAEQVHFGDKIDPTKPVVMNQLNGSYLDGKSKIIPVKVFTGKQIYDSELNTFIAPKLFGQPGTGAYWADFDWGKASELGMKAAGLPYSGKYGFVSTVSYWRINHMVSPKDAAVSCNECHVPEGGRLAKLESEGLYIPGRDRNATLDSIGYFLLIATFFGVLGHGLLRIVFASKRK